MAIEAANATKSIASVLMPRASRRFESLLMLLPFFD
jgi:hypothetical protein